MFQEGKFESFFIEVNLDGTRTIVGEIYRVPNTQEEESIRHFQHLLEKLKPYNNIIGTDQNFDPLGLPKPAVTITPKQAEPLDQFLV